MARKPKTKPKPPHDPVMDAWDAIASLRRGSRCDCDHCMMADKMLFFDGVRAVLHGIMDNAENQGSFDAFLDMQYDSLAKLGDEVGHLIETSEAIDMADSATKH